MKKMMHFLEFLSEKPLILALISLFSFLKTALELVEIYLFRDWMFLCFLLVLIHLDTILGFWEHAKRKNLSSSGFAGYFEKVGVYGAVLIVLHILTSFPLGEKGEPNFLFFWLKNTFYVAMMVRESISILERAGGIRPGLVPAWVLRYLKKFDDSGKLVDLQQPEKI